MSALLRHQIRPQARDGIDHHGRGQLAAAQDVVADGNLVAGKVLGERPTVRTYRASAGGVGTEAPSVISLTSVRI